MRVQQCNTTNGHAKPQNPVLTACVGCQLRIACVHAIIQTPLAERKGLRVGSASAFEPVWLQTKENGAKTPFFRSGFLTVESRGKPQTWAGCGGSLEAGLICCAVYSRAVPSAGLVDRVALGKCVAPSTRRPFRCCFIVHVDLVLLQTLSAHHLFAFHASFANVSQEFDQAHAGDQRPGGNGRSRQER